MIGGKFQCFKFVENATKQKIRFSMSCFLCLKPNPENSGRGKKDTKKERKKERHKKNKKLMGYIVALKSTTFLLSTSCDYTRSIDK